MLDLHQRSSSYEPDEILLLQPATIKMPVLKVNVKMFLVRAARIELTSLGWKPRAHPIYHASLEAQVGIEPTNTRFAGGGINHFATELNLVRPAGIEPASARWQRAILPLNDGSENRLPSTTSDGNFGAPGGIRTHTSRLKRTVYCHYTTGAHIKRPIFEWCRRLELNQLSLGYQPSAQTGELLRR